MKWACPKCRFTVKLDESEFPFACPRCRNQAATPADAGVPKESRKTKRLEADGPGTELHLLLEELGIRPESCSCEENILLMNQWGVTGCRLRRDRIAAGLREEAKRRRWTTKLKAAVAALGTSLLFVCNPLDPYPGLVEEAIRRAEQKQESQNHACNAPLHCGHDDR